MSSEPLLSNASHSESEEVKSLTDFENESEETKNANSMGNPPDLSHASNNNNNYQETSSQISNSPIIDVPLSTNLQVPQTPDSIASSMSSYSPVTDQVGQRAYFMSSQSQILQQDFNDDTIENVIKNSSSMQLSYDHFLHKFDSTTEKSISKSSTRTFSSDDTQDGKDLDLFESFHGSNKDFVTEKPADEIEVMKKYSNNISSIAEKMTQSLQLPNEEPIVYKPHIANFKVRAISNEMTNAEPINVQKQRKSNEATFDPKKDPAYRSLSRSFTPVSNSSADTLSQRLLDYEDQLNSLDTKRVKLQKEIEYVDKLLQGLELDDSLEVQKLRYARGKLQDRLMDAQKDKYDVGVKVSKYRRKLYGEESGVLTEYFARKVSNRTAEL